MVGRVVLTSRLRQPLGSLPIPDGSVNQKQRSEISSLLEALLSEIDLPSRESLVSDDLPLGFRADVRTGSSEIQSSLEVVELDGEIELVVWVGGDFEGELLEICVGWTREGEERKSARVREKVNVTTRNETREKTGEDENEP